MDLHTPVMDGYMASKEMKKINRETPIIAVTAHHAFGGTNNSSVGQDIDYYLGKPVSKDLLIDTITSYLPEKRQYLH